jgi:hypothetical protein
MDEERIEAYVKKLARKDRSILKFDQKRCILQIHRVLQDNLRQLEHEAFEFDIDRILSLENILASSLA